MSDIIYENLSEDINPLREAGISKPQALRMLVTAFREGFEASDTIKTRDEAIEEAESRFGGDKALTEWFVAGVEAPSLHDDIDKAVLDFIEERCE